jgi:hypothetical protein
VEYMEFPFGKFHRGACEPERAIKSVTLGPKCALSPSDVTAVMDENGFKDFDVVKSGCEIR